MIGFLNFLIWCFGVLVILALVGGLICWGACELKDWWHDSFQLQRLERNIDSVDGILHTETRKLTERLEKQGGALADLYAMHVEFEKRLVGLETSRVARPPVREPECIVEKSSTPEGGQPS